MLPAQNKFTNIIARLLPFIELNGDVKGDDWSIADELLDWVFPAGKHQGKTFETIIASENSFSYCVWWTKKNVAHDDFLRLYPFFLKLSFVADSRKRTRYNKREIELEKKRAEFCHNNGIDYEHDYAIRHNPQLRDFGM